MNLKQILSELNPYNPKLKHKTIEIKPDKSHMLAMCMLIKENLNFRFFLNLHTIENDKNNFDFHYTVYNQSLELFIRIDLLDQPAIESLSLSGIWHNALYHEKESYELFGTMFDSLLSKRRYLFPENLKGFPSLKNFEGFTEQKIKPESRKLNGFVSIPSLELSSDEIIFDLSLDEKSVSHFDFEMGFRHFGIEKDARNKSIDQVLGRLGYINPRSCTNWSLLLADAIESEYELIVPEKAQAMRMIVMELTRINEHLYTLLKMAKSAGYADFYVNLSLWYQQTSDQIEELLSHRNPLYFNCIGGVTQNIPGGWSTACLNYISKLEKDLAFEYKNMISSKLWTQKLNCGEIERDDVISKSLSGPVMRAAGLNHDLRKDSAKYFYPDVSFDIPLGIGGKAFDRFLVLIEEIFQSVKILFQVLDNIPAGGHRSQPISDEIFSERKLIHSCIEGANGIINLNALIENGKINTLKLGSNSQNTLQVLKNVMIGSDYDDVDLIWHSLQINMSEVEK
jgi:Ni,Fe-hydrogenase III large subunit/Ni,Fe-hydrogenase III component G